MAVNIQHSPESSTTAVSSHCFLLSFFHETSEKSMCFFYEATEKVCCQFELCGISL